MPVLYKLNKFVLDVSIQFPTANGLDMMSSKICRCDCFCSITQATCTVYQADRMLASQPEMQDVNT